MRHKIKFMVLVVCLSLVQATFAKIILPGAISSSMVLQQQDSVKLWGWARPSEQVIIKNSWNNQSDTVVADAEAKWQVKVLTPTAGGPYSLTFTGENQIILDNVMIGEVWLCSGQSNMEWSYLNGLKEMEEELKKPMNKNIRFLQVPLSSSKYPQDNIASCWTTCDSSSLRSISAIGYFFALKMQQKLGVPVGIISAAWGGTPAEVWTPTEVVDADSTLKAAALTLAKTPWWPVYPGSTFNSMIYPLSNFKIKGVLFYQGEGNTFVPSIYNRLFTSLIKSWREKWELDFPFFYVQIAPFNYETNQYGYLLREQQVKTLDLKNTGMIVISDLVDDLNNIHPKNKHDVGYRLADMALGKIYGIEAGAYQSPIFKQLDIKGERATLSFDLPLGRLTNDLVAELLVAGTDKIFHPANAEVKENKLIVWNRKVKQPVAVRYSFSNAGVGSLKGRNGMPVVPFRTDSWEIVP